MFSNYYQIFLSISPVFFLIILGNILRRINFLELTFWEVSNKLAYWVLMPALLFYFISQVNFSSEMIYSYGVILFSGYLISIVCIVILGKILSYSPEIWTSILQGGMRQNAFIALAIAGSLFGAEGLKIASLFTFIYVPSINIIIIIIMVINLNQNNKESKKSFASIFNQIFKNPFIIAMILGSVFSFFDLEGLTILINTTELLGSAALPLMLLTIGAKIRVRDLKLQITPILISNSFKLLILPIFVYFLANFLGLTKIEVVVAVIFSSVPTATMSYTFAKQFGADDKLMRGILTTQVALSFITIPLLLAFIA